MILQRLAEHYDRIVAEGKSELAPPGKSVQKVSFCVVLNHDGSLHSFADLRQLEGKKMRPVSLVVSGQSKPTGAGLNARFLWDNAEYMLGWSADPLKQKRAPLAFVNFRDKHLTLEQQINHPAFTTVCNFLRGWAPEHAAQHSERLADISTNFGVFRILGETAYVHEQVIEPTREENAEQENVGHCLVCGEVGPVSRLHEPKIKGVNGAQTSGALLVSFNASAFESYGKGQSYNAPVSVGVTFRYTNALNHLLDPKQKRRVNLGDATLTYWADHPTILEDAFAEFFGGSAAETAGMVEEDRARVEQARRLIEQLRDGTNATVDGPDERGTKFYVLGLSPNASRLSVRLWIEQDAPELRNKLAQHVRDFALAGSRDGRLLPAWQIVQATGRAEREKATGRLKSYDTRVVSPQLAGELARSILAGGPYPQSLLATMIRRIRSDGEVSFPRVSAIKAVLVRNSRLQGKPMEINMELNEQERGLAYRCGRIFAVLERAQEASVQEDNPNAKLNATIKDRFFGAAAATPLLVLPRLLVLNNHHMRKLKSGSRAYFSKLLGSIMEDKPFTFPRQLTLEEQGQFIVGYFQQRQEFFKNKEQREKESQEINQA